jgi:hypothetical protein
MPTHRQIMLRTHQLDTVILPRPHTPMRRTDRDRINRIIDHAGLGLLLNAAPHLGTPNRTQPIECGRPLLKRRTLNQPGRQLQRLHQAGINQPLRTQLHQRRMRTRRPR